MFFTPAQLISEVDKSLSAIRELWLSALDRGPRETLRHQLNALLDQRIELMRLRDSAIPVQLVVCASA